MMVMDNYYNYSQHQFSAEMLWNEINALHLSYLNMEESPEKIEHKDKLESCVHSYLCVAHHNQKFECGTTPMVLHKSAKKADFSGYKAAVGWDAIGRYAANLIMKPWRKEYRQIKMYSGFYKHEVESNLEDADKMFIEMGYKLADNQILKLHGPVCPDRLTSVSLDSIMAYVECQILKEVWEKVSKVCEVSWLDVLSLRETHAGNPQETIQGLIYMKKMPPPIMTQTPKAILPYYAAPPLTTSSYSMYPNPSTNCCGGGGYYPQQSQYHMGGYNYNNMPSQYCPPQPAHSSCSDVHHHIQSHCNALHNAHHNHGVPTAQLIELDVTYDQPDGGILSSPSLRVDYNDIQKKMTNLSVNETKKSEPILERDDGSGTYESWDYVYRNLESQGYSKDLGERGDLLQEMPISTKSRSKQNFGPEGTMHSKRERRESKLSTYDNVSEKKAANPLPEQQQPEIVNNRASTSNNVAETPTLKGWHCMSCTYLNANDKDICDMCSRSRKKPADEHLQVGGTQCEKCTFVNNKGQKICKVCGASLNNSPTYI